MPRLFPWPRPPAPTPWPAFLTVPRPTQVKELLTSFGPLKAFNLVKDMAPPDSQEELRLL